MNAQRNLLTAAGVLSALGFLVLCFVAVQMNALEARMAEQAQQLRSLGEATERVAGELRRVKAGGGAAQSPDDCSIGKVLHPEVENFLKPPDTRWPPSGANTSGTLFRGWSSGDPKGFNPILENAAELRGLIENYAGVALAGRNRWTDPDQWHGELACRVEVTDDFKEFTFYLRKGVKWHVPPNLDLTSQQYRWLAGEHEVTAHDVAFALDILMHPQVENGFIKNYYKELDSWKAVDDYTLVVRWKKKQYLNVGATLELGPLPKFLYAHAEDGTAFPRETLGLRFNQHWYNNKGYVGAGPYRMTSYEPGRRIVLERNQDYFGDKPAIARLEYPIYTDPNLTLLKLKSGELSFGGLRPSQYREEIKRWQSVPKDQWPKNSPFLDGTITCSVEERPVYRYVGWNASKPIFSDKRVRRAMTLALNRQAIIEQVFVGLGEQAIGPFLASTGYNDPDVDRLNFDLSKAAVLLAEAGWKDSDGDGLLDKELGGKRTPLSFSLLIYGSSPEYSAIANIFKDDLLKIGVKLNIDSAEWSLMQKRMDEKTFDAYTGAWALSWETDAFQIWHSSQADIPNGSNYVGFRNKQADELIETLRVTFEEEERKRKFRELHRIIYDEQVYTFLIVDKGVYCWRNNVKNVIFAKARPIEDSLPWWVAQAN